MGLTFFPEVLFHDSWVLAVHKPPGIHVHPTDLSRGEVSLQDHLTDFLGFRPSPVHRLDRPTSGVVLFALDSDTARYFGEQFQSGEVSKTYESLVRGWCPPLIMDKPLEDLKKPGIYQESLSRAGPLKYYEIPEPLGRYETVRVSRIELFPVTGRRHQLRRHIKSANHPIVGDTQYPDGRYNEYFRQQYHINRLMLHSRTIIFSHPHTGNLLDISTDWDSEILNLWSILECFSDPTQLVKEIH